MNKTNLTGFLESRAHLSKAYPGLPLSNLTIFLLFPFNLNSSFCPCFYPLWSLLHSCCSQRTISIQQYHFTPQLQDWTAHHYYVIQHLHLNPAKIHIGCRLKRTYEKNYNSRVSHRKSTFLLEWLERQNKSHFTGYQKKILQVVFNMTHSKCSPWRIYSILIIIVRIASHIVMCSTDNMWLWILKRKTNLCFLKDQKAPEGSL